TPQGETIRQSQRERVVRLRAHVRARHLGNLPLHPPPALCFPALSHLGGISQGYFVVFLHSWAFSQRMPPCDGWSGRKGVHPVLWRPLPAIHGQQEKVHSIRVLAPHFAWTRGRTGRRCKTFAACR